jgi:hypothetical protein
MDRTFNTFEDAIDALCDDHPGAIIDHVYVIIDDCAYDLQADSRGRVTGTDTFAHWPAFQRALEHADLA